MRNSQKAFTLIELLLYVSILGTIVFSIVSFLSLLMQSRIKNQAIIEIEQQGVTVIQIATQAIRNADIINSPTIGTTATSLSINTTTPANNPTIFDLSSGNIRIKEGSTAPINLINTHLTASNISFRNVSRTGTAGAIRIQFTLTYINPTGRNEYNFSKDFYATASLR